MRHVKILEDLDFEDIAISIKFSDVQRTMKSYELISSKVDYPLHVGVTEAGTVWAGTIANSIGIGALLLEGIGDTIRVSLAGPLTEEVRAGFQILKSLELREKGPRITACPTCGRTEIDLIGLAEKVEQAVAARKITAPIHIAVMGCVVNGPGEAREADIGVCGGKKMGVIIKKGIVLRNVPEENLFEEFMKEVEKTAKEHDAKKKK
jgi:(E)-4-hydroxy-3-methylbut-2-enyl-diphosphate synthase